MSALVKLRRSIKTHSGPSLKPPVIRLSYLTCTLNGTFTSSALEFYYDSNSASFSALEFIITQLIVAMSNWNRCNHETEEEPYVLCFSCLCFDISYAGVVHVK